MQNPSPSKSIIYMSPNNQKFAINTAKPLIQDEGQPPHFHNEFQTPVRFNLHSPEKVQKGCSAQHSLSHSSTNKLIQIPLSSDINPFCKFQDEGYEHHVLSKERDPVDLEISPNAAGTRKKAKKYIEVHYENLIASPKIQDLTPEQSNYTLQDRINHQYEYMLEMIKNGEDIQYPQPFFFRTTNQDSLTKLICFDINSKNGKYVKYDMKAKTCLPIYKCLGCEKQFNVSSALGGHLSKCERKDEHFSFSMPHSQFRFNDYDISESYFPSIEELKKQPQIRRSAFRQSKSHQKEAKKDDGKKNNQKKQAKRSTKIHRCPRNPQSAKRIQRSPLIRSAKVRACLLIKEVIRLRLTA